MFAPPSIPSPFPHHSASFMDKLPQQPTQLYLHQQRTVEVIQLIEVPPPPPRSHPYTSTIASSSFASSSCDSSDDDSEDDESVCSSYCSSEEDLDAERAPYYDDTYKTRLNRVLAWRDGFTKATAAIHPDADPTPGSSPPRHRAQRPPLTPRAAAPPPSTPVSSSRASSRKRKADDDHVFDSDDDTVSIPFVSRATSVRRLTPRAQSSQSSKRSRSLPPQERTPPSWQQRRFSAHSCSACDACFTTIQSLRQHGKEGGSNDACREAVEYGFEP